MERQIVTRLRTEFDSIVQLWPDSDVEFWLARDLQAVLGYAQWRNFQEVIAKAKTACENAGIASADHFADVSKMVELGSGAERSIDDVMLTRYAFRQGHFVGRGYRSRRIFPEQSGG